MTSQHDNVPLVWPGVAGYLAAPDARTQASSAPVTPDVTERVCGVALGRPARRYDIDSCADFIPGSEPGPVEVGPAPVVTWRDVLHVWALVALGYVMLLAGSHLAVALAERGMP